MSRIVSYVRRNYLALAALFVALGGTAVAVDGPNPGQNTIGSEDIIGNEVKSDDIGNGRIFNLDIADDIIQSGKIKDDTIAAADLFGPPAWTPIPLASGYGPFSGGFYPVPACYRDLEGVVHLRGVADRVSNSSPDTVGSLPAACMPASALEVLATRFSVDAEGNGSAPVLINSGGVILIDSNIPAMDESIGFDSITFR